MVMEAQHFQQLIVRMKELYGTKFKIRVDLKEKITEEYLGEVYQGISRCIGWRSITRTLVGIQSTGGFAYMSRRKL